MRRKVSLILTTYNCQENLKKTLESIDKQDYPDIEVVIKDGASTDGTIDIIREYAQKNKDRVLWTSSPDNGIYDAMNQGYKISGGDYILFFNDLFVVSNAISLMVDAIESDDEAVGCHSDLTYSRDGRIVRRWQMGPQRSIYSGWMPGHPSLLLRREVYEKHGLYRNDLKISSDYEFIARILKNGSTKLAYVPRVLVDMYYGGTSSSGISSYWRSLKEAHRGLKINGYRFAMIIDLNRIIRFVLQFVVDRKQVDLIDG